MNEMKRRLIIAVIMLAAFTARAATVTIRPDAVVKHNVKGASGANLSYLLDSDKGYPRKITTVEAMKALGVGSLRFPYGHLADNYLWTVPPFEDAVKGLKPAVASMDAPPAKYEWATDRKGFHKKSMDFDEYMHLCKVADIEPLVVVNVLSFQYDGGPTREQLIESAAAWVRYANVVRKYGVKYWQLGNEVEKQDSKSKLTKELYSEIYGQMASAMKKVDPSIKVGTGILSKTEWTQLVLEQNPGLVDWVATHQYTWHIPLESYDYKGWKEYKEVYVPNVNKTQQLLDSNPAWSDVEMLITETNSSGSGVEWSDGNTSDLFKSLIFYEMNMSQLTMRSVKYTYFWCTHSPWLGENVGGKPIEQLLDRENNFTSSGQVVQLINSYLLPNILTVAKGDGYLRFRASISDDGHRIAFFALNKGDKADNVEFSVDGDAAWTLEEKIEFSGKSPQDQNPTVKKQTLNNSTKTISSPLPPCSLTIFRLKK